MHALVDFTKAPEEVLVNLVNIDNATDFKVGDLTFEFPRVNADSDAADYNTQIMAWGGNTGRYSGRVLFKYNKALLNNFFPEFGGDLIFLRAKDNNLRDFTQRLGARFGIQLYDRDLKDAKLPVIGFEETVTFEASDDSLIYRGFCSFRLRQPTDLAIALNKFYLNGLPTAAIVPEMTAEQLLLDQLSIDNPNAPYAFDMDSVQWVGPPVAVVGDHYNTRLFLQAKDDYGYKGKVGIYYRRNSIQTILHSHGYWADDPLTPQGLLDQINADAGSYLKLDDLLPFNIPAMEVGQIYSITLTPQPNNLAWNAPGVAQIAFGIPKDALTLHTLIETELGEWFGLAPQTLPINAAEFHEFTQWTMPNLLDPTIELTDVVLDTADQQVNSQYLAVATVPGSADEFNGFVSTTLVNYYGNGTDQIDQAQITDAEATSLDTYLNQTLTGYFQ